MPVELKSNFWPTYHNPHFVERLFTQNGMFRIQITSKCILLLIGIMDENGFPGKLTRLIKATISVLCEMGVLLDSFETQDKKYEGR